MTESTTANPIVPESQTIREIRGRNVQRLQKVCQCGTRMTLFQTSLDNGEAWNWSTHRCQPTGPAVDPKELLNLARPSSRRQDLALEIERARDRRDSLGDSIVEALQDLDRKLPPEPTPLFDIGSVRFAMSFRRPPANFVPDGALNEALDRHQAGDFGVLGTAQELPEITPEIDWCPGAFGNLALQALALRDQRGQVLSRHHVDYIHQGRPGRAEITVQTILVDGVGTTIMVPAHQFSVGITDGLPAARETRDSPWNTFGPPELRPGYTVGQAGRY